MSSSLRLFSAFFSVTLRVDVMDGECMMESSLLVMTIKELIRLASLKSWILVSANYMYPSSSFCSLIVIVSPFRANSRQLSEPTRIYSTLCASVGIRSVPMSDP